MAFQTATATATKHYLDVGANDGTSMLSKVGDPNNIVYAFEPVPFLRPKLEALVLRFKNFKYIPKAVSNKSGVAPFFISPPDYSTSSLAQFNTKENLKKAWGEQRSEDFLVEETTTVEVITLQDFVEEYGIKSIEFLHVDAQGRDMEVLQGLGNKLSIVKEGVIEMPISHEKKLYKDQLYVASDAIAFLEGNGFKITNQRWNDAMMNEVNIYFSNLRG